MHDNRSPNAQGLNSACRRCRKNTNSLARMCITSIVFKYLYSATQQPWANRGSFGSISSKKRDNTGIVYLMFSIDLVVNNKLVCIVTVLLCLALYIQVSSLLFTSTTQSIYSCFVYFTWFMAVLCYKKCFN